MLVLVKRRKTPQVMLLKAMNNQLKMQVQASSLTKRVQTSQASSQLTRSNLKKVDSEIINIPIYQLYTFY